MRKAIVNGTALALTFVAAAFVAVGPARPRERLERGELLERVGPPVLALLSWMLASIIAVPLVLSLLVPFLI